MIPICSVGNPAKTETDEVVIAERRHIDLDGRSQDSEILMVFLMKRFLCLFVFVSLSHAVIADEALSKTLMTQRGRLLASEDFTNPLPPATGTPRSFASGFTGWRFNKSLKSGKWDQVDGTFRGIELTESHHPATASYGIKYGNVIIQCDVRLDDVPADGRPYRSLFIKATDEKDYVCSLSVGPGGIFLTAYDSDRMDPKTKQRMKEPPVIGKTAVKMDGWYTLVLEIMGDEAVGTLDGHSVRISNPLLSSEKHSVMLGASTQASFRHFRIWEALPNPDWARDKQAIPSAALPTPKSALKPEKLSALDIAVKKAMKDGTILGATLWVERKGESYHRAWGQRTAQPPIEAMTEDTLFDVASITKVMVTTSSAMLCVERGLIGVDDLVSKHLPEFIGEGREKVTLRHLLLHSSGLPVNLNSTLPPFNTPADALAQACRTKLLFEPGSAFSYSSAGTMVLGAVIERVTGRKLDQFSTTEIFAPLRMTDTVFRPEGERLKRVSPTSSPARGLVDDTVARVIGGVAAHASLFTTTSDMARFARMMLNFGELNGVRIFQPETVKFMTSVQSPPRLTSPAAKNLPVRRGLGWDIDTPYRTAPHEYTLARGALFPIGSYGHTGWTGQMLWIDPFSQTFVIFLCNRYVGSGIDTHHRVQQLHHRISTLAAEAVIGFDFKNVVDALPGNSERESGNPES